MRLHRFYTTESLDSKTSITIHSPELVHQVRRVFRLKVGDSIVLFNGTHFDYECKIDGFGEESTIVSDNVIRLYVTATRQSRSSPTCNIYLCAAVTKKDTFEWIVEKATELGVTDIIPVIAERSEKKSLNESRLNKIAVEASEQSGRGTIPMVHPIMGVEDAANFLKKENADIKSVVFHTEGDLFKSTDVDVSSAVAIFIGPEGGWSPKELEMFHSQNIPVRCLGPQVLRAETAVVATLSMVVFGNK
jgi:16S rRNA (uracil1498-N3)-methyltransferase